MNAATLESLRTEANAMLEDDLREEASEFSAGQRLHLAKVYAKWAQDLKASATVLKPELARSPSCPFLLEGELQEVAGCLNAAELRGMADTFERWIKQLRLKANALDGGTIVNWATRLN